MDQGVAFPLENLQSPLVAAVCLGSKRVGANEVVSVRLLNSGVRGFAPPLAVSVLALVNDRTVRLRMCVCVSCVL